jgi:hypothetical protein
LDESENGSAWGNFSRWSLAYPHVVIERNVMPEAVRLHNLHDAAGTEVYKIKLRIQEIKRSSL